MVGIGKGDYEADFEWKRKPLQRGVIEAFVTCKVLNAVCIVWKLRDGKEERVHSIVETECRLDC